jgi:ribosomal protein S8
MDSEIKAIINYLGNYASNDKPQRNEHNVIIPFSLHYTDANLLFSYICELEEENEKSKNDIKLLLKENGNKEKVIKKQEEILNKAIEYIESYNLPKDLKGLSEAPISVNELKVLLNILKGEENESN